MSPERLSDLIRILQTAVSPVVLISGVGLLLLSMTNRFGRTIDRARLLSEKIRGAAPEDKGPLLFQIRVIYRRSRLLMWAVRFALAGVFSASLLIVSLFATFYECPNVASAVAPLFLLSMTCLCLSLIFFMRDMALSLTALKEELKGQI